MAHCRISLCCLVLALIPCAWAVVPELRSAEAYQEGLHFVATHTEGSGEVKVTVEASGEILRQVTAWPRLFTLRSIAPVTSSEVWLVGSCGRILGRASLIDLETGERVRSYSGSLPMVSPDGRHVASVYPARLGINVPFVDDYLAYPTVMGPFSELADPPSRTTLVATAGGVRLQDLFPRRAETSRPVNVVGPILWVSDSQVLFFISESPLPLDLHGLAEAGAAVILLGVDCHGWPPVARAHEIRAADALILRDQLGARAASGESASWDEVLARYASQENQ